MSDRTSSHDAIDAYQRPRGAGEDGHLMWKHFTWRGNEVVVIQQWTDPFGHPMLRFADVRDENMAAGMSVDQFLVDAMPSPV